MVQLGEMQKIPKGHALSEEETIELIKMSQQGDKKARDKLVEGHLRLILSLLKRFAGRGWDDDDLFQVGIIGLLKAIDKFDFAYGTKFSTYAVPLIIGEMRRAIRDDQPLRVSRSLRQLAHKAWLAKEELYARLKREPTLQEISEELAVSPADLAIALESNQALASLQDEVTGEDKKTMLLADVIAAPEEQDKFLLELELRDLLKNLPPRLSYILNARYFQELTQSQIAEHLHVSQAQVCRLEKQALQYLKKYLEK